MTALEGIRIIELTTMVSGPYAGMLLADMGAELIKVEPPEGGEITRHLMTSDPKYQIEGMGPYFLSLNRNKKSITLNLKSDQGLELFYRLVEISDVVLNNFRVGVVERLKVDYANLVKVNPKIITCSITGFGETGPKKDYPAYDMVAQAMSGVMSMTGQPGGPPTRSGIPIADMGGSLLAVSGILAAIISRTNTGKGQHVDISMLDSQISALNYHATAFGMSGENPGLIGSEHNSHVPYNVYPCKDGHIIIGVVQDSFWENLMKVIDVPDLNTAENKSRKGRLKNREHINERLARYFSSGIRSEWIEILSAAQIPCAPVNNLSEALTDAQISAREMWVDVNHPNGKVVQVPGNAIKMSAFPNQKFNPAPKLGQNNEEIYNDLLEIPSEDIVEYKTAGVI